MDQTNLTERALREEGVLLHPLLVTCLDIDFATFRNPNRLSHQLYGAIYKSRPR
jgi:hypothetical protein